MFNRSTLRSVLQFKAVRASLVAFTILAASQFGAVAPAAHAETNNSPAYAYTARAQAVVSTAMRYLGYRYRFGGSSPAGFDCSGFVYYVYNSVGIHVGRDVNAQYNSGVHVSSSQLMPGDIVIFANTYKRGLSHAGIYIGGGRFINAANESTGVIISNLWGGYWGSHYAGAVRP